MDAAERLAFLPLKTSIRPKPNSPHNASCPVRCDPIPPICRTNCFHARLRLKILSKNHPSFSSKNQIPFHIIERMFYYIIKQFEIAVKHRKEKSSQKFEFCEEMAEWLEGILPRTNQVSTGHLVAPVCGPVPSFRIPPPPPKEIAAQRRHFFWRRWRDSNPRAV